MIRAIQNLLSRSLEEPAGCGYLSSREVEALLEGRLAERRAEEFRAHRTSGCADCTLLAADLEVFHGVAARGLIESEKRQFRETERVLKAHLRQKLEAQAGARAGLRGRSFTWTYALGTAAAAVLIVAVAVPFLRTGGVDGARTLTLPGGGQYELQAVPFSSRPTTRDVVDLRELWNRAGEAYVAGDYAAAESLFGAIASLAPEDDSTYDALVYRASALLMAGRAERAAEIAREAIRTGERDYLPIGDALYLLGTAEWKLGRQAEALEALRRAKDAGGHHGEEAAQLLERLESAH